MFDLPAYLSTDLLPDATPATCLCYAGQLACWLGVPSLAALVEPLPLRQVLDFFLDFVGTPRRSFQGSNRRYVTMGTDSSGFPPALTLSIPPRDVKAWKTWAHRQPAFLDDSLGKYVRGMRVDVQQLLTIPNLPSDLALGIVYGYGFDWLAPPPPHKGKNYASCALHVEEASADFDRMCALGFLEGPLDYLPHTINSIACILKLDPYKVRNVVDSLRSHVNECMAKPECVLDMLEAVLSSIPRFAHLSKFDITDAFLCWPVAARWREVLGVRHPRTNQCYRYAFMPFGIKQAPALQQRWATVLRLVLNEVGLQFTLAGSPEAARGSCETVGAYLDDFLNTHDPVLSALQKALQYTSLHLSLRQYRIPTKPAKDEPPAPTGSWIGFTIDPTAGTVDVTAHRRDRLLRLLQAQLLELQSSRLVPRREWASLIGKLQHCCTVVRLGQSRMRPLYLSRDHLVDPSTPQPDRWLPEVICSVSEEAIASLEWWQQLLAACPRGRARRFLWQAHSHRGFLSPKSFPGFTLDDIMAYAKARGWTIVTCDASGYGGGAWAYAPDGSLLVRHVPFPPELRSAQFDRSSNLREMYVPTEVLQAWSDNFPCDHCFLTLLDNTSAVAVVNHGGSMEDALNTLAGRLLQGLVEQGSDVLAWHIPGANNTLADGISRLRARRDDQDWQLVIVEFRRLQAAVGPFTLDACSDPLGQNSFCERFYSSLDPCTQHSWVDEHVWCNPPFNSITTILRHFWACHEQAPHTTSAVFLLPVWPQQDWWSLVGGARVVATWPQGSYLFTSPEWRRASPVNPLPIQRVPRGLTRWPVVCLLFPRSCSTSMAPDPRADNLPRLCGDSSRDLVLLRDLWKRRVFHLRQSS